MLSRAVLRTRSASPIAADRLTSSSPPPSPGQRRTNNGQDSRWIKPIKALARQKVPAGACCAVRWADGGTASRSVPRHNRLDRAAQRIVRRLDGSASRRANRSHSQKEDSTGDQSGRLLSQRTGASNTAAPASIARLCDRHGYNDSAGTGHNRYDEQRCLSLECSHSVFQSNIPIFVPLSSYLPHIRSEAAFHGVYGMLALF